MQVWQAACAALLIASTAACGGRGASSPTAPSSTTGTNALTGATIQGQVQSSTPMMAATTGAAASGLTVTVLGTTLSANVTGTGQFVLSDVPAGSTQLNFSGPGVNATIAIAPVQGTETISVTVKISGNHAEVESEEHQHHGEAELHGNVTALSGAASAFEFRIGGTTVRGDGQTTFFGDGNRQDSFSTLRAGARVEVKGALREGFVYAQRIHINGGSSGSDDSDDDSNDDDGDDDDDDDAGEAEVSGPIAGLKPGCPAISFSVGSTSVITNSSTEYKGASCSTLKNGDRVKVEGTRQPSGAILAREVKRQ